MDRRKKFLKKAYNLGYFVGFYGHSEWLSWIAEEKKELYERAKIFGMYENARKAYSSGKNEGIKRREEIIRKGLSEWPAAEEQMLKHFTLFLEEELEWLERKGHLSFLKPVKNASPERLLRKHEMLKKPKFFNLPRFLKS